MPDRSLSASFAGHALVSAEMAHGEFAALQAKGIDTSAGWREWSGLANSYRCPIGEQPGRGWLLMLRRNVEKLDTTALHSLVFSDGVNTATFRNLIVVGAHRVIVGASQDPDAVYLVEVADCRWLEASTSIDRAYNVRQTCGTTQTYCPETMDNGTAWTWQRIVQDLWSEFVCVGTAFSCDILPQNKLCFSSTPENLEYRCVSVLDALSDVLRRIGCRLRWNPLTATMSVVLMGLDPDYGNPSSDKLFDEGGASSFSNLIWPASETDRTNGDMLLEDAEVIVGGKQYPESVDVCFPANYSECYSCSALDSIYRVNITASDSVSRLGSRYGLSSAHAGTKRVLYDAMHALFEGDDSVDPSNLTALQTRAKEIADEYYRILVDNPRGRWVYSGIKTDLLPGPFIAETTWRMIGDGLKTEVKRYMPGVDRLPVRVREIPGNSPTTTTTPAPANYSTCAGSCEWTWSASTSKWTATTNNCSTGPTTTTAPTTTTTGDPGTTTTTGCPCPTTTTSEPTTTTTTTTAPPCGCAEPTFCGTADGQTTATSCTQLYTCPPPSCTGTTTTTCDCATTTTLPPAAGCEAGCDWVAAAGTWVGVTDGCTDACPCQPPSVLPADSCDEYHTPCNPTTTTPSPLSCEGTCEYWWNTSTNAWNLRNNGCIGAGTTCRCVAPTIDGVICAPVLMPCGSGTQICGTTGSPCSHCYTSTTTTSTTTPGPCSFCEWTWATFDSVSFFWQTIDNRCSPCSCAVPGFNGASAGEWYRGGCGDTTTPSPTTTTTTTTTTSCPLSCDAGYEPGNGYCVWVCTSTGWEVSSFANCDCEDGHQVDINCYKTCPEHGEGSQVLVGCCVTTTTAAPTTTTTADIPPPP